MRLTTEAHAHVEKFFRAYLRDECAGIPQVSLQTGLHARAVTFTFRIGAITFGRRVLVAASWLERDAAGRLSLPAWLVVHELMHVIQYRRAGTTRFLRAYLRAYLRELRGGRRLSAAAHRAAYKAIPFEVEACAAAAAYEAWAERLELLPLRRD